MKLCKNAYEAAEGADALVIVTEWKEFRSPDFDRLKQLLEVAAHLRRPQHLRPRMLGRFGFTYYAIGRGRTLPPSSAMLVPVILSGGAGTRLLAAVA